MIPFGSASGVLEAVCAPPHLGQFPVGNDRPLPLSTYSLPPARGRAREGGMQAVRHKVLPPTLDARLSPAVSTSPSRGEVDQSTCSLLVAG